MRLLTITLVCCLGIIAQSNAQCVRTAELMRTVVYNAEGTVVLEELANGDVQFRLPDDFITSGGPDVQIWLSNDMQRVDGGIMLINLSEENHFSGARTIELPNSTDINEFRYVVIRCIRFGVFWGGGALGISSCDTAGGGNQGGGGGSEPSETCVETLVATTNWVADLTICPNDGEADVISLMNTVMIPAGDEFAYIITNTNSIIQEVVFEDTYDFEGSSMETQLVRGVSFSGTLTANVGQPFSSITASGCSILSGDAIIFTIQKGNCAAPAFECETVNTITSGGQGNVTICPTDGIADVLALENNLNIPIGDNFVYLKTDEQNTLIEVIRNNSFDFEGRTPETVRIHGISFSGNLNLNLGDPISSITASECMELSAPNSFLTINIGNCPPPPFDCQMVNTFTTGGETSLTICPTDGQADFVNFQNNGSIETGDNFAYLVTDDQNNLVELVRNNTFNFEGSGSETNRVFAISYSGNLNFAVGNPISSITATECFQLSDSNVFLTINKGNCQTATFTVSGQVTSAAGDGIAGVEILNGDGEVMAFTNEQGEYTLPSVEQGTSMSIRPRTETSLTNGVSGVDVVIISNHLLDLNPISNAYTLLAADVNNDNVISSVDLIQMIRAIVGLSSDFANNTTWRFIDASQAVGDGEMIASPVEEISVIVNGDTPGIDFIGVKIGDVNENASLDLN